MLKLAPPAQMCVGRWRPLSISELTGSLRRSNHVKGDMRGTKFGLCCVIAATCAVANAQEPESDQLKAQLRQMHEAFERQRQEIEAMQKRIDALERSRRDGPLATTATNLSAQPDQSATVLPPGQTPPASSGGQMRLLSGARGYMDISFDGLFAVGTSTARDLDRLELGAHDPNQRGFTVQNLETTFSGAVDPYFQGQANIIFQIDAEGESILEVEEAFLETVSLPANLQVKGGQFFTPFGRHNQFHPHAWSFVDVPLVSGRFLGGDGLRNPGGRVAWLTPTPFFSELSLTVQNSQGETAFSFRNEHESEPFLGRLHEQTRVKAFGDLLFVPRYTASFDVTDSQTLLLGASAAFGPNASAPDAETRVFGLDLFWKWKAPTQHGGFPFVAFQTEVMARQFQAGAFNWDLNGDGSLDSDERDLDADGVPDVLPRETVDDWGFYSQLLWGFRRGWVAGLRGDYVDRIDRANYERLFGNDEDRGKRWRVSPNITWYPTEYSKLRLQYNFDCREAIGTDHSVWLQFEFLLGSHAAHRF